MDEGGEKSGGKHIKMMEAVVKERWEYRWFLQIFPKWKFQNLSQYEYSEKGKDNGIVDSYDLKK